MLESRIDPGPRDWWVVAEKMEVALQTAQPGKREAATLAFGKVVGLAADTLRTYAMARRYLRSIEAIDESLARDLRAAPVLAVTTLARWQAHNPVRALEAAQGVAKGLYTVRALRVAERKARSGPGGPQTPKAIWLRSLLAKKGYLWGAPRPGDLPFEVGLDFAAPDFDLPKLLRLEGRVSRFPTMVGGYFSLPHPNDRNFKVDLFAGEHERRVALLLVGPYANPRHYIDRAADWMLKASGLAHFYPHAGLLLPEPCDLHAYTSWGSSAGDRGPSLFLARDRGEGALDELASFRFRRDRK